MKHWIIGGLITLLLAVFFLSIVGFGVMYLWNLLMPTIFNTREIDFWQAIGLLALCRLLFGNIGNLIGGQRNQCEECGGSGWAQKKQHWKNRLRAKMSDMSLEEREQFKAQMHQVCNGKQENEKD
jgi:hypothetical protein